MRAFRWNVLRELGQIKGKDRFLPGCLQPLQVELGQFHKFPRGSKRSAGHKRTEMRNALPADGCQPTHCKWLRLAWQPTLGLRLTATQSEVAAAKRCPRH
jgi:hypothetical protein